MPYQSKAFTIDLCTRLEGYFLPLTDLDVRRALPKIDSNGKKKRHMLLDDDGLYLEVMESGSKFWRYRYCQNGEDKRKSLGRYPGITLAMARRQRDELKEARDRGDDIEKILKPEKVSTFGTMAEAWYAQQVGQWSATHAADTRHKLDAYLLPVLAEKPIREITVHDILIALRPMVARNIFASMKKAKIVAGQVLQFAMALGEVEYNVTANMKGLLPSHTPKHFATITEPRKIAELVLKINDYNGYYVTKCALWFILRTFQRPGMVQGATWDEIDLDRAMWTVPAKRMKRRREHLIPLSSQNLELLRELKQVSGHGRYVFLGREASDEPISDGTLLQAIRRMGFDKDQMCAHGFRALASTVLNSKGIDRDVIELQLSHQDNNSVRAAYNHADRLPERIKMMQDWADWLDSLIDDKDGDGNAPPPG